MCGRFTREFVWGEICDVFDIRWPEVGEIAPSWNVAPTQVSPVVRLADTEPGVAAGDETGDCKGGSGRELVNMRWGLVPFWAKEPGIGTRMFNAWAETVCEKPAFRAAFARRRCVVPVSGFYEWKTGGLDAPTLWDTLARPIPKLPEYNNKNGRPPWSTVTMLKCLMLAKWNNLSDPQPKEQLLDRFSFRKFVSLSFTDATPDETYFVRFRKRPDDTHTRDEDAYPAVKHGKNYSGYKAHIAVDVSGIVTGYRFATAREHGSKRFDELVKREQTVVYADSAYTSGDRRQRLRRRGVIDGICYKRNRGLAELYDWQMRWNEIVSRVRAKVEHTFAMLKHQLGLWRVRYRGLERNGFDICMALTACNLKRSVHLAGDG